MTIAEQLTRGCVTPLNWIKSRTGIEIHESRKELHRELESIVIEFDLTSQSRKQPFIWVKQFFEWYLVVKFNYKLVEAADLLDKDHATIASSRNAVWDRLDVKDATFLEVIKPIQKRLIHAKSLLRHES